MSDCIGTGCKADSLMERIAALEAERADLIKINNKWAGEWDQMREERDGMLAVIAEQMIEIARLTKLETECWSNPEAWMKWCDVRVLERVERAETEVLILRNDLATYAERIAALDKEQK